MYTGSVSLGSFVPPSIWADVGNREFINYHQFHHHQHHRPCHLNTFIMYSSCFVSLILVLITLCARIYYRIGTIRDASTSSLFYLPPTSSYIIINMLTTMGVIQMIFLFGDPFKVTTVGDHSWSNSSTSSHPMMPMNLTTDSKSGNESTGIVVIKSSNELNTGNTNDDQQREDEFRCKMIAMVLHYLHLVASFWILSHSLYMYKRLWRYHDDCENLIIASFEEDLDHYTSNGCNYGHTIGIDGDRPSVIDNNDMISSKYNEIDPNSSSIKSNNEVQKLPSYNRSAGILGLALFSWIVPMLCVIISYYLNPVGYETRRYCWMSIGGGMMYSFIVPISLLMMINTLIMCLILKRFFAFKPVINEAEIDKVEPCLRSGVSLLPFFAVNWFLSVLALESTSTNIFQYLFSISNFIQHLLVFIFHLYQTPEIASMRKNFNQTGCEVKQFYKSEEFGSHIGDHHSASHIRIEDDDDEDEDDESGDDVDQDKDETEDEYTEPKVIMEDHTENHDHLICHQEEMDHRLDDRYAISEQDRCNSDTSPSQQPLLMIYHHHQQHLLPTLNRLAPSSSPFLPTIS
ncbi:uncharacterized protein LOC141853559 [Brevipalpus obovatus]|uniref:uncharacterized protein LOC141853559 n=1 Tax=Brevipalpus obovatus TaxID=246614 RepID=UPI003D9F6EB4